MNRIDNIAWRPGFNDADPMGWIAFAAYAAASILCIRAARSRDDSPSARQSKRAWLLFALALGLLGLNLQLDLHTLLFQWARRMAQTQGWYEKRRSLQQVFMVVILGTVVAGVIFGARHFQTFVRTQKLAVTGALLLIAYVLFRNASFNHIDDRKGSVWDMKDSLRLVELTGVAAIGLAASRYSRSATNR